MFDETQIELGALIVYKGGALNDNQGFLVPLFSVTDENEYNAISREDYPSDILISRGYTEVDSSYHEKEIFMLRGHYKDKEKTLNHGAPRYWAKGDAVYPIATNTLLPIFKHSLPPKETGALPNGVVPPRGTFFLSHKESLYGPLTSNSTDEGTYLLEPVVHPSLSFGKDYLGIFDEKEIRDCTIHTHINNADYHFVTSLKELGNHKPEKPIDFMPDERLIKYFNQKSIGPNLKALAKKEADKLQDAIVKFERMNKTSKSERFERLKNLVGRYLTEADSGYELIKNYLDSSNGSKFLNNYVETNQSSLLSGHLDKIEQNAKAREFEIEQLLIDLNKQIKARENELDKIQQKVIDERENSNKEIEKIKADTKEHAKLKLKEQQEELSKIVESEEKKLEDIKKKVNDVTKKLGIADSLDDMYREKIFYERSNDILKSAARGYEGALKNPQELATKMGEMEVISRVLKGGTAAIENTSTPYIPVDFTSNPPGSAIELVDYICNHFDDDGGRQFSQEEMTNLLVSFSQSFMTVLAGPPGVGKTSSVIRLANALHLGEAHDRKNFLYIPVGRGWVSGRDILGFYNSLKNVYQPSRTGLYDFLNRSENKNKKAPQIILLDEANLSSVEHYWSDFLGMCDHEGRARPLDTGIPDLEKKYLNIGDNIRFIATINNDSTTERLSPRLIDRVPVISLDHESGSTVTSSSSSLKLDGAIDINLLNKFFKAEDAELSRADKFFLDNIINILNERDSELGQPVPISFRKHMAITNYCAVAGDIIGSDSALDFAISQHILPHIEGYGSKFKNRISRLLPELSKSHPRSTKHVERILNSGNDFTGTYSFF